MDLISRQDARHALEAQERQYTFGNDEFNLEAAYHDCKMVFDGITDDDSFQEADTGVILYYANEIIYALHEALEGKDTNVLSDDCISRQAAIDKLESWLRINGYSEGELNMLKAVLYELQSMPSAQPDLPTQMSGTSAEPELCEDAVSRKDAIWWVKTECNPYGKPTLDFESGKKVIEHLKRMSPVTPKAEQQWIPCSERLPRQGQEVICQCRANMIKVLKLDACGDWYQDAEHCYMSGFVIAWMPLPEPYREGVSDRWMI